MRLKPVFKWHRERRLTTIRKAALVPELQLLMACARSRPRQQDKALQKRLIEAGVDWDLLLALAERHRVVPLVWKNLGQQNNLDIPSSVLTSLEQGYLDNAHSALGAASEIVKLGQRLNDQGIQYMVLKGLPVAIKFYGDPVLRHVGDLDILLDESQLLHAREILSHANYREAFLPYTALQSLIARKFKTQHDIFYLASGLELELHWRLFPNPWLFPLEPLSAIATEGIPFGEVELRTLPDEDLLIYLCVHGDVSLWARLKWQFDLPQFLEARPCLDWDRVMDRAKELGATRSLNLGLALAQRFYDVTLPRHIIRQVEQDRSVHARFKMICHILRMDRHYADGISLKTSFIYCRYLASLRTGVRYQLFLWFSLCISREDWQVIKLPDGLFFLYILLRPLLSTIRWLRKNRRWQCGER